MAEEKWNVDDMHFPHEKLQVYRVGEELVEFTESLNERFGARVALRDQLERAADSVVERIAEGASSYYPKQKRQLYSLARGSAAECAVVLETALKRKIITPEERTTGRRLATRVFQMLTKLIMSFDDA